MVTTIGAAGVTTVRLKLSHCIDSLPCTVRALAHTSAKPEPSPTPAPDAM